MNGSLGYSKEALKRLETGTYRGRQQKYRTSEEQVKAVPKKVPALEGMTRSPSFDQTGRVDTANARARYEQKIGHTPIGRTSSRESASDKNYVVKRDRYNKLMRDSRLANDIKTLAEVNYNNANQDATISQEYAENMGARHITGGFTKDQFIKMLGRRYNLTPKELEDMALTFHSDANKADVAKYGEQLQKIGEAHPILGSAGSLVGMLGSSIEGAYNTIVGGITGDDRYLSNMFSTTKKSPREGAKKNIKSNAGKTAYDIGMGIGDMAVGAAAGSAPVFLAGNTANEAQASAFERGSSVRKASAYGGAAGILDFVTNKIGLDKAKKLAVSEIKSTGIKKFLQQTAVAGAGEAMENVYQDIGQSLLDQIINGKNSELRLSYEDKIANGMSESDAFKAVAKEYATQIGLSAATGFGMGSAMQAGTSVLPKVPEIAANKWANAKLGAISDDPTIRAIVAGAMEVPEPVSNAQKLQPDLGKVSTSPETPVNRASVDTAGPEKLQTPMEKPTEMDLEEDLIGDVIPETNTRGYTPEEIAEINDYVDARNAIRAEMDKSVNIFDPNSMAKINDLREQGRAMDAEMADKYPELFENGKFTGVPDNNAVLDNLSQTRYNDGMIGMGENSVNESTFNPEYNGVDVEYSDRYVEPERIMHSLTGKQASPEYAAAVRKLESGQMITSAEYNAIPEIIEAKAKAGTGNTSEINTPERQAKRSEILNTINAFGSAEEYVDPETGKRKVRYSGPVARERRADIIIGLPSSGKSSAVVDPISNKYKSKLLDSDEVKKLIPEFDDGWGAGLVHEESKDILAYAKAAAFENGENVVLPVVGSNADKIRREIQLLQNPPYNYEVHLHLNDLAAPKAAARNMRRFASQGRFLDLDSTSFEYGDKPREVYEQLKKEGVANGYTKVSNDVRIGENPVQLEGTEVIPFDWRNNGQSGRTGVANPSSGEGQTLGEPVSPVNTETDLIPNEQIEQPSEVAFSDYQNIEPTGEGFVQDGKSRVVTHSGINADIISRYDYDNDPVLQKIATYAKHNNETTYDNALNNVKENGTTLLEEYNNGSRIIDNDQDVDQAMILLQNLSNQLRNGADDVKAQRDLLFSKLREAGTKWGQNIQAFAKYNDTPEGAIINGERILHEPTEAWKTTNKKKVESNNRIAKALADMGNKWKQVAERPQPSHEKVKETVINELNKEFGSVEQLFDDADIEFLTILAENKDIPVWMITSEIEHKLNTGDWYTLDESIEMPKPTNQRLDSALKSLVEEQRVEAEPPTLDQIREEVRNSLDNEYAGVGEFTDEDVNYLANLINNGATREELADALNTKLATGRFAISEDTQNKVNQLFEYADHYDPESREAVEAKTTAYQLIANEVVGDATPLEKFETWRYLAMLGNPKTWIRNAVGNGLFNATTSVSNTLAAAIEAGTDKAVKALGGNGIQRTKTFLNPTKDANLIKAAGQDAEAHRYSQLSGTKYEKGTKDAIRRQKSVFNSKLIKLYEKVTDAGVSDYAPVKAKYSTSLAGYMKANGLNEKAFELDDKYMGLRDLSRRKVLTDAERSQMESLEDLHKAMEKARDYAVKQAEYATFHEDNAIAQFLTEQSVRARNSDKGAVRALGYLLEGTLPFKKTPANILRSGIEYSPLGAIKSIAETGKLIYENTGSRKGNLEDTYTQKSRFSGHDKTVDKTLASDVIDSWAKTLTGSGLLALGYYLKSKGILNSSDKDEKYQDDLEGIQNYSITINGKTYTVDWAAPAVMPMLVGAEISKMAERNAIPDQKWYGSIDDAINSVNALLDPIFETSMMQGVKNTLESAANEVRYNDDGAVGGILGSMATTMGTSYLTQALPTLSGQIARTVDPTRRTSDTASDSNFLSGVEKQGRKLMNKIPGLSYLNEEYRDAYGRTQNNSPFNNPLGNLAYQMMSPAYIRDINTTAADTSARKAYDASKDSKVFPTWKGKVTEDGVKLDPKQMSTYRKASGEANYQIRDALAKQPWFNELSGDRQSDILKKVNTLVDKIGKEAAGFEQDNSDLNTYKEGGIPALLDKYQDKQINKQIEETTGVSSSANVSKELKEAIKSGDQKAIQQKTQEAKQYAETKKTADEIGIEAKTYDKIANKAGSNAEKVYKAIPELKRSGLGSASAYYQYADALAVDPGLSTSEFVKTFNSIDEDNSKGIKQDELINFFNKNKTSQQQADKMWKMYGDPTWKKIPKLEGGSYKKVSK